MRLLLNLSDLIGILFCRHHWIRDRHPNGELWERCMKCMKERPHNLYLMCRWQPPYTPIEPITQSELPPPLAETGKLKRAA